jgi:2-haloacid dehalogenase
VLQFDRFEALTFDCFGTLIDWETGILGALRPVLHRHGVRAGDDELLAHYARLEGEHERGAYVSYRDVLARVMEGIGGHYGFGVGVRERACIAESLREWQPFPDTVAALGALAGRYRLVICSNIDDDLFVPIRERLGAPIEWVVTAQYCRSYKPGLRHFRVALALLDLPPGKVLHVAESLYHDVAPARSLGIAAAWVNRRAARGGTPGASGSADAAPDAVFPDLASLARAAL